MVNTTQQSPDLLSDILGAQGVRSLSVEVREFGAPGQYEIGRIVSLDGNGKVVVTAVPNKNAVYGVNLQERLIIDLDSERRTEAVIARHGSFKAEKLLCNAPLRNVVTRLRELGCYLEGLEAALAPPFRIRTIDPTWSPPDTTNLVLHIWGDGSF